MSTEMLDYMEGMGLGFDQDVPQNLRPWMQAHKFVLVRSLVQLRDLVDKSIASGMVALDLETEGFDNRVYFDKNGRPFTYKKIVGYCLCYDGVTGYYVPVAHRASDAGNLDYEDAAREIARLCYASQPIIPTGSKDPLADKTALPGKVKILFWNAKFDQEWLYPVTHLRFWHPDSFEDGALLALCANSDWAGGGIGLKERSLDLKVTVPDYTPKDLQVKISDDFIFTVEPKKTVYDAKRKRVPVSYEMMELKELFKGKTKEIHFANLHPEEGTIYGSSDAICTYLLLKGKTLWGMWEKVKSPLKGHVDTYRLEKQVTQAVREMERNRFKIDLEKAVELSTEAAKESEALKTKIEALARKLNFPDFDIRSSAQLGSFLFDEQYLNLEPKPERNEKSGQWKTGAEVLEALYEETKNEVLQDLVKFRQIDKVIGTYLNNLHVATGSCPEGTLRSNFNQTGAATGRFTAPSGDPLDGCGVPSHGIPSTASDDKPGVAVALRYCFVCEEDEVIVKIDFAGQELRAVTNICLEPVWLKEFLHGTGDLHTITAQAFFGKEQVTPAERKQGKISNFGLIYGGGPQVIIRATGCSREEGVRRKQAFDAKVTKFASWVKEQHKKVKRDCGVRNAYGRWVSIPGANLKEGDPDPNKPSEILTGDKANALRASCERRSTNYPIQSAGADMMKISMVTLYKEFHKRGWLDKVKMRLTVHDEIVYTVKKAILMEAIPVLKSLMEAPGKVALNDDGSKWTVPMQVEILIDKTWAAKHEWESMVHGFPYKPGDKIGESQYVIGDRKYARIPDFLKGYVIPDHGQPIPEGTGDVKEAPPPSDKKPQVKTSNRRLATFEISTLNRVSASEFAAMVARSFDESPDAVDFKLVYRDTGATIIDSSTLGYPGVNETLLRGLLTNSLL